jgi:hypothetical protein
LKTSSELKFRNPLFDSPKFQRKIDVLYLLRKPAYEYQNPTIMSHNAAVGGGRRKTSENRKIDNSSHSLLTTTSRRREEPCCGCHLSPSDLVCRASSSLSRPGTHRTRKVPVAPCLVSPSTQKTNLPPVCPWHNCKTAWPASYTVTLTKPYSASEKVWCWPGNKKRPCRCPCPCPCPVADETIPTRRACQRRDSLVL